mmetsp:Transcript_30265/g.36825  ORF Transcript_30265/g.36825 Transcript_30265/m.36825 type:complete len:160 (-) Transcript_30265:208-687(-)
MDKSVEKSKPRRAVSLQVLSNELMNNLIRQERSRTVREIADDLGMEDTRRIHEIIPIIEGATKGVKGGKHGLINRKRGDTRCDKFSMDCFDHGFALRLSEKVLEDQIKEMEDQIEAEKLKISHYERANSKNDTFLKKNVKVLAEAEATCTVVTSSAHYP